MKKELNVASQAALERLPVPSQLTKSKLLALVLAATKNALLSAKSTIKNIRRRRKRIRHLIDGVGVTKRVCYHANTSVTF